MSDLLPLFPLPNVVLFPNMFLPLHIFEPRYRELVVDAVASDRMIGMVLLQPGWENAYAGRPAVYPIGCSGVITHVDRLADGRYNIVLRGVERFQVVREEDSRSYRRALVEWLVEEEMDGGDSEAIRHHRSRLEALLASSVECGLRHGPSPSAADSSIPASMADADLVNALAQYLDFEPLEKQALLERCSARARAESLVELLEIKTMMARSPRTPHLAH